MIGGIILVDASLPKNGNVRQIKLRPRQMILIANETKNDACILFI